MFRLRYLVMLGVALASLGVSSDRVAAEDTSEKSAAEATVRSYEQACEHFDFAQANALLAPDARWIEDSYPVPAEFTGQGWSKRWEEYKAAKLLINYQFGDFNTHIRGDVAWITLTLDSTFTADNKAALALNQNQQVWRGTFVETYVMVKIDGEWKVALGHTSLLPGKNK
jgi:hypothetical protein